MNADRARTRVWSVIRAARRIQDSADVLGQEARARLPDVTGLTHASIELALSEHFETNPADSEIETLLASTTRAPVCHVILSANVFVASLRALVLAVATSERVFVRLSRRDPVITELLVRGLLEDAEFISSGAVVKMVEMVRPISGDELHVYGSDESITTIMVGLPDGVVVRAHGTGIGIAVVGEGIALELAADALTRDIVAFDQRGCLSPRFVFVDGDAERAERFAYALHQALDDAGQRIPRGLVDDGLLADIARYRSTMEAIGSYWFGPAHGVGFDPAPRALVLPPAARIVHIVAADAKNVQSLLVPWIRYVTAIGMDNEGELSAAILKNVPEARRSRLGWMQRPLLDGPVDGRTKISRIPLRR